MTQGGGKHAGSPTNAPPPPCCHRPGTLFAHPPAADTAGQLALPRAFQCAQTPPISCVKSCTPGTLHSALTPRVCLPQDGHYIIRLGESLIPRYKILKIIGEGTFGKVTQCWDREKKKYVAVKIIKSIQKYRDAATVEIEILKDIQRRDVNKTRCPSPPAIPPT